MKRLRVFLSVFCASLMCATVAMAAVAAPAGWKKVGSPISASCYNLSFSTANVGLALIGDQMKRTTNGGSSWASVGNLPDGFRLSELAMATTTRAYAVGSMPYGPEDEFLSKAAICVTEDGGATWQERSIDATDGDLNRVVAVGADRAWAVGDKFRIYATTDGGATWVRQNATATGDGRFECVSFLNATTGWAGGPDFTAGKGVVFRTTDGGSTWTRAEVPAFTKLSAIGFSDATHGWTAGYEAGKLYKTTDGGVTWKNATPKGLSDTPRAFGFASKSKGWMVSSSCLWQTVNGGKVWSRYLTRCRFWSFSMPSRTRAYAFVSIGGGKTQLYRWKK